MISHIVHIDQQFFLFINSLHSPFFDQVMHALSGIIIWLPLYLAILIYLITNSHAKPAQSHVSNCNNLPEARQQISGWPLFIRKVKRILKTEASHPH